MTAYLLLMATLFASGGLAAPLTFRAMSYNVYYKNLWSNWRLDGIATTVANELPDIVSIQEMWRERFDFRDRLSQKTGVKYEICDGGPDQVKWWDGKIFYRADRWTNLEDGVDALGADRGMTYAALKHLGSGAIVLVYGVHPLCCGKEWDHMNNIVQIGEHQDGLKKKYPGAPIVFMGDFNEVEKGPAMVLMREGSHRWGGRDWSIPLTFIDSFREVNGWEVDATTFPGCCRLDYIYRDTAGPLRPTAAKILWNSPGGSDHNALTTDFSLPLKDGQWTPVPAPTPAPTDILACPTDTLQVGGLNADINSCGMTGCGARHKHANIDGCRTECEGRSGCVAFSWAPKNGDKLNLGKTVCSLYDSAVPDAEWGPRQLFCKLAPGATHKPTPEPTPQPTPAPLKCVAGSVQVGTLSSGNDINGCGMDACDDRSRAKTIEECHAQCVNQGKCLAYNWAPVGGDKLWKERTVCTMYAEDTPNHDWGPKQLFCKIVTLPPKVSPIPAPTPAPVDAAPVDPCANSGKVSKASSVTNPAQCEQFCKGADSIAFIYMPDSSKCECFGSVRKNKDTRSWVVGKVSGA